MADIVFIVANKKSFKGSDDTLKYFPDCTVSINHTFTNDVTEHAVEDGASFTDHIQNKNNTFTVSGIYSPHSLNRYFGDAIQQDNRVADAYTFLRKLRDDRSTFTLVSKYDVYNDCVVRNLTIPTTATDGNTLIFELEITQIRKSKLEQVNIVAVQNVSDAKKDDASSNSFSGKSPTNTRTSVAKDIKDSVKEATDLMGVARLLYNGDGEN